MDIYANKPYSFEKTDVRGQKIKRIFSTMLELKNDSKHYLYALLGTVLFYRALNLSILYKVFVCSIVPNYAKAVPFTKTLSKHFATKIQSKMIKITLYNLPKVSLNDWYAGGHWTKRKRIKDIYKLLIKSQYKKVFKVARYEVSYEFGFKKNPLDASNCVAMLKLIEDIIFEKDDYKYIKINGIESKKSDKDYVLINIKEL